MRFAVRNLRVIIPIIIIISVGVIGAAALFFSRAAGPFVTSEPENGTVVGPAVPVTDSTASGGRSVRFANVLTSANPYGSAEVCELSGDHTIIRGWATDPDSVAAGDPTVTVTVNGKSVSGPSDQLFREAEVNAWIDNNRPGDPKPGTYGFRIDVGVLDQGASYVVTGTVNNIGPGANIPLSIYNGTITSGDGAGLPSFLSGDIVPPQCLGGAPTTQNPITKACGDRALPPQIYDHVIWIYEENHQYDQVIGTSSAPYMTSLAKSCGTSTKFTDSEPVLVLHPELKAGDPHIAHSNQIYPTNIHGGNCTYGNGIKGTKCWNVLSATEKENLPWRTILDQLNEKGLTWKAYEENMPSNCYFNDSGLYHNDHNPIFRLTSVRSQCKANDVTIPGITCPNSTSSCSTPNNVFTTALKNGTLPNFVHLIPNVDNMMHDGTVRQADNWLKMYLGIIFNSAEYKKGKTAVFVLWDEPSSTSDPNMPFLAMSPSTTTGISSTTANGFAVLRATEQMFGISEYLGCASGTPWHAPGAAPPSGSSCYPGAQTDIRKLFNM